MLFRSDGREVCFIFLSASTQSGLPLQPAADTCSSSPADAWCHCATYSAIGSRALAQTMPFPLYARHLHANSSPASLRLAHCYHERNAMAGHCMRAEKHLAACLAPSFLCTCKLACQTATNDVAGGPQRFVVSSPCSSLLRTTTTVPAFVLP